MRTSVPDVFAAGDVVSFPLPMMEGHRANIGHWQMAHSHGRKYIIWMLILTKKIQTKIPT